MDTQQLHVTHPVSALFSDIAPESYPEEIDKLWRAAEAIRMTTQQQVEAETITPLAAVGVLGTTLAQLFGVYERETTTRLQ